MVWFDGCCNLLNITKPIQCLFIWKHMIIESILSTVLTTWWRRYVNIRRHPLPNSLGQLFKFNPDSTFNTHHFSFCHFNCLKNYDGLIDGIWFIFAPFWKVNNYMPKLTFCVQGFLLLRKYLWITIHDETHTFLKDACNEI